MQEIAQYSEIMVKGNLRLKACADSLGIKRRNFRKKLFKEYKIGGSWPKLIAPGKVDLSNWKGITKEQLMLIWESLSTIDEVRKIESRIVQIFTPLVCKLAGKWSKKFTTVLLDKDDYIQEAYLALQDAIYCYTDINVKFITFSWISIRNRCIANANSGSIYGHLKATDYKLLSAFERKKEEFMTIGPITDEAVMESMNLSWEKKCTLRSILSKVTHLSNEENKEFDIAEEFDDDEESSIDINEAIIKANLNEKEKEVINKFMNEERGWQVTMAEERNVTRQAISLHHRDALRKIETVLTKKAI